MWTSFTYPHLDGLPENLIHAIVFVVHDFMHVFFGLRRQTHCLLLGPVPGLSSDIFCTRALRNNDMFENAILLYILCCCSIAKPRMMTTVVQWTVEDVAAWLEQCLHLPYAEEFVQAGFSSWGQKCLIPSHFHFPVFKALV